MADEQAQHIWVMSNRVDDRVVLFERDPAHPGGEAFVGGDGVAQVGKTTQITTLLREGLLVEVPEPPDGPKKPMRTPAVTQPIPASQPGQPAALGRQPDPELFGDAVGQVVKAQERLPDEVPVPAGVIVPPPPEPARETRRR
jgi:hypothetical protein